MTKRQIAIAAFMAISSLGSILGHAEDDPKTRAISFLSNQFETVVYTKANFLTKLQTENSSVVDSANILTLPYEELGGGTEVSRPQDNQGSAAGLLRRARRGQRLWRHGSDREQRA